jgi:extradiol dioxygenase family protein
LGDNILPSFHFGVIVDVDLWGKLYSKLFGMNLEVTTQATFLENRVGEHLSFFIKDPNGYMVEIKSFKNYGEIFSV